MSDKNDGVPHVDLRVTCPVKGGAADVGVDVNIFRERGTLTGCTHLDQGEKCAEGCLVAPETRDVLLHIMAAERSKHKEDLGDVGPNVVA